MKKLIKKSLAVLFVLVMLSGTLTCFAAELNQDAVNLHYGQFEKYVLLGDSVASGYRDEMTENDEAFNEANQQTVYYRVPGSYADVLAEAIIADNTMTAFAAPGYRTVEIRYMLEDDFNGTDEYLFHPSQLNVVGDAGSEEYRTAFKQAVAEADLITLGVGGNDWGAYLGWVVSDVLESENVADKYIKMAEDVIADNEMDLGKIEQLLEIAHLAGALPVLAEAIPEALEYGLGNFYANWDIMIQDIYDLNPDVTIMVLGMSDTSVKGNYFDYDGVEGEPVNGSDSAAATADVMTTIVDFIMSVGNKPMIDGAKTFGYTYVDTAGTTYVDSHPDADGHVYIANKIIEALPDPEISTKYEDVAPGHKNYSAIEYVLVNGIMSETSETTFSPDDALTSGELVAALNAINGTDNPTDGTDSVSALKFALSMFGGAMQKGMSGFFAGIKLFFNVFSDYGLNFNAEVTRGEAAYYFMQLDKI